MSLKLYHCADCRLASLAASLLDAQKRGASYVRHEASTNEIPEGQAYKAELVELIGDTSGLMDCRDVWPTTRSLNSVWLANEIASFALREEGRPAILKWLDEPAVRRFHNLDAAGHLVRPYGYDERTYNAVIEMLTSDPESKRCLVTFQRPEFIEPAPETPCAVSTQYLLRDGALWTVNVYRSHDFFAGVRTDPVRISAVQQAIARDLGVMTGPMVMQDGSLHFYPRRQHTPLEAVASYHCQTSTVSPRMEMGTTSQAGHAVHDLLEFARAFRRGPVQEERLANPTLDSILTLARNAWQQRMTLVAQSPKPAGP